MGERSDDDGCHAIMFWGSPKMFNYLKPGTEFTVEPSLNSHVTNGVGLPCAAHDTFEPVSLLNVSRDEGSVMKVGYCKLSVLRSPVAIVRWKISPGMEEET
jgi:hypothetical protein